MLQFYRYHRAALVAAASVLALCAASSGADAKATNKQAILHTFTGTPDGAAPYAGLVSDAQGNFYGTTYYGGGGNNYGTVFKIAADGTETVLYAFSGSDGANPYDDLILDKSGNLYGTTSKGGDKGAGVVFKLTPKGTETVLHSFTGGTGDGDPDGGDPVGGLAMDKKGNVYGTTAQGGGGGCGNPNPGCGTIFKVTPTGAETVMFTFSDPCCNGGTGINPTGDLIIDNQGRLYGTFQGAGPGGFGGVFTLTQNGQYFILHSFTARPSDGANPWQGVIMDKAGNLYGTTPFGGDQNCNCGVVYKLAPDGTETVLHEFTGGTGDLASPYGGLAMDAAGNLYGTTTNGGSPNCNGGCGGVYRVTPDGVETVLYSFNGTDDYYSFATPILDKKGNLYATTVAGGSVNAGVAFELTNKAKK